MAKPVGGGGAQPIICQNCCRKLRKNERNWTQIRQPVMQFCTSTDQMVSKDIEAGYEAVSVSCVLCLCSVFCIMLGANAMLGVHSA